MNIQEKQTAIVKGPMIVCYVDHWAIECLFRSSMQDIKENEFSVLEWQCEWEIFQLKLFTNLAFWKFGHVTSLFLCLQMQDQ